MPIDFGKDGWQIRKRSNGRKQITDRSPRNMRHALSDIVSVEDLSEPGKTNRGDQSRCLALRAGQSFGLITRALCWLAQLVAAREIANGGGDPR